MILKCIGSLRILWTQLSCETIHINFLFQHFKANGLFINVKKCSFISFSRSKYSTSFNYITDGESVPKGQYHM